MAGIDGDALQQQLDREGHAVVADVLEPASLPSLREAFAAWLRDRPGARDGLDQAPVRALLASAGARRLLTAVLGDGAFAYRATLFDKNDGANWLVAWHQDLVVPVRERGDADGFGPWSEKHGVIYVQPPVAALERALAVRFDLDGSDADNGALRVLPGSHRFGVLGRQRIDELAASTSPVTCVVPAGAALLMRPLLLHASSRAVAPSHRRVLHVECASRPLAEPHARGAPAYRWQVRHDAYTELD